MPKKVAGGARSGPLSEMDVVDIRVKYWQLNYTQGQLAREKRVTINTIGRIVRGETWQEVGGPGSAIAERQEVEEKLIAHAEANAPAENSSEIQTSMQKVLAMIAGNSLPPAAPAATDNEADNENED